jgi:hypothetical protein
MLYCIEKLVTRKRQRITILSPFWPKSERLTTTKKQYFDSKEYHLTTIERRGPHHQTADGNPSILIPHRGGPLNKEHSPLHNGYQKRQRKRRISFNLDEEEEEWEWNNLRKM